MRREVVRPLIALAVLGAASTFATSAHAQSEVALRSAFEGRTVTVKLDMPASDDGIDVFPQRRPALEFPDYARRIKRFGTSVRKGEGIMVTKVRVKKDRIEFQLGGGGYGTFGDDTGTVVSTPSAGRSQREKNLEQDLKREGDPARRRAIQEELDSLRRDREREDRRNEATTRAAEEDKKRNVRERRVEAGSRFNVRFADRIPDGALTADGLRAALAEWVDFGDAPVATDGVAALRKGLTRGEVEAVLGPASRVTPRKEGALSVESAEYRAGSNRVNALFVEGVLVRFSISSN